MNQKPLQETAPSNGIKHGPDPEVIPLLQVDDNGNVKPTMANILAILRKDAKWRERLGFDTFARTITLDGESISDARVTDLRIDIGIRYGFEPAKMRIWEVLHLLGQERQTSSLRDVLDGLRWDGTPRLNTWLTCAMQVEDTALYRVFARRWAIGAVARAYEPGCKLDTVLLLVGPQGTGKSRCARLIAGDAWFADTELNLKNKDGYLQLGRVWIYEVAEMTAFTGVTAERVKAFVTSTDDNYRPPYGRAVVRVPRQTVFIATTNDETPLGDPTGSRRFWPVAAPGPLDASWLTKNRLQLWAEAVEAYKAGEQWYLTEDEEHQRRQHAVSFERMDPWTAHVERWASAVSQPFTLRDLLVSALNLPEHRHTRGHQVRVGHILRQLGHSKRKARRDELADGSRPWLWFRDGSVRSIGPSAITDLGASPHLGSRAGASEVG